MFIAITALKGGVGKTTTAVHLAAYMQTIAPTLLIDADKNRSALVWAKEDKLPFLVASQAGSPALIPKFTHIVVDTQARPELDELKDLATGSDLLILPTTPNPLDLDSTLKAIEFLKPLGVNYRVLLTKVDSRTSNGRDAHQFIAENDIPIFKTEIPLLVAFQRAPSHGVVVQEYSDRRAKIGWSRYREVGKEIITK